MMTHRCTATQPALWFNAGFVDITPTHRVPLAGYAGRSAAFDGIDDPLEANAVLLSDGQQLVIVVTFDLLYVGDDLRNRLEAALSGYVFPGNLFLSASHTHFAPATDATLPKLGTVDRNYVNMVSAKTIELVQHLLSSGLKPLKAGMALGRANNSVNRRRAGWQLRKGPPFLRKVVKMESNRSGVKDERVQLVRIGSEAIVWNYACHPVFRPEMNSVSADYVGFVRQVLRKRFGPETVVLFWQGFSGNTFPSFASTLSGLGTKIKRVLFRRPVTVAPEVWHRWAQRLACQVVAIAERTIIAPVAGQIRSSRVVMPLGELLEVESAEKMVCAHKLDIGTHIQVLGMSAEMVVEYVERVRSVFNSKLLFCVGCTDGVFGYVPTSEMLLEGGYEAAGFLPYFSLLGRFLPGIEGRLCDRLLAKL
jgi:hypothetical protein